MEGLIAMHYGQQSLDLEKKKKSHESGRRICYVGSGGGGGKRGDMIKIYCMPV